MREIARQYLATIDRALATAGKRCQIDDDALELLVNQGYSLAYGARFLKRVIDERVKLTISARWRESSCFHVRAKDGEVVVEMTHSECLAV